MMEGKVVLGEKREPNKETDNFNEQRQKRLEKKKARKEKKI